MLSWPLRHSEVLKLAVYTFSSLEHTELSEIKDATALVQQVADKAMMYLWCFERKEEVEEESTEWFFSEGSFGRRVKTM